MSENYVKVPAIYKKLKTAETEHRPVYIGASVGYGKTSAVKYYYRNKQALWLTGEGGCLSSMPMEELHAGMDVIIDDLSWIREEKSKQYILSLLEKPGIHVVLIGRAKLPGWLKAPCIRHHFVVANEKDLELDEKLTEKLLACYGVSLPKEEIDQLATDCFHHGLFTTLAAYQLQNEPHYTARIRQAALIDTFHYYDKAFYEKWDHDMRELLMAVAEFPGFTPELARMVTGNEQVPQLLAQAMEVGDFMYRYENDVYKLRPMLQRYFNWKQETMHYEAEQKKVLERGGLYYEMHGGMEEALECYDRAGNHGEISRLLIKNAGKHVGIGHYYETRKYYLALSEEEILQSPVLVAGISMLQSLLLHPEKSEYWYDRLKELEHNSYDSSLRKEARIQTAYLDVSLPHRGTNSLVDILRNLAVLVIDKKVILPDMSVTSNLPSIMNGGKDFCDWSRKDRELARTMKRPIELILGKWGAGLVNIALAESYFEKGNTDYYEIMTLLNNGYVKADANGKIEMCFVAAAILGRVHIVRNQPMEARNQMLDFEKKLKAEGAERMLPNLHAYLNDLNLMEGNLDAAKKWLEEAPNENVDFFVMERYRYMSKVRTYLALGRNEEALNLIERLSVYYSTYSREYLDMENEVLRAITQYRLQLGDWKETLRNVLLRIESYHFLYLIGREGIAIRELLNAMESLPVQKSFEKELFDYVNQMTLMYPRYLKVQSGLSDELTEMEKKILHLYCEGIDAHYVCELCGFTYNTLRYHNKNLYRKLNVGSRTDAERIGREMGL